MKRIKYEFYAIRDVFETGWTVYKKQKSLKIFVELFVSKGTYTTLSGGIKKGTYHQYQRDFWFGDLA